MVAAGAGAPAPNMCRSGKPPGLPRVRGSGRMAPFLGVGITVCGGGVGGGELGGLPPRGLLAPLVWGLPS